MTDSTPKMLFAPDYGVCLRRHKGEWFVDPNLKLDPSIISNMKTTGIDVRPDQAAPSEVPENTVVSLLPVQPTHQAAEGGEFHEMPSGPDWPAPPPAPANPVQWPNPWHEVTRIVRGNVEVGSENKGVQLIWNGQSWIDETPAANA
jgi:hypothetical protein